MEKIDKNIFEIYLYQLVCSIELVNSCLQHIALINDQKTHKIENSNTVHVVGSGN